MKTLSLPILLGSAILSLSAFIAYRNVASSQPLVKPPSPPERVRVETRRFSLLEAEPTPPLPPLAAIAERIPAAVEEGIAQLDPAELIFELATLPDIPGDYWVRQSNGTVGRVSICSMTEETEH